MKTKLTSTLLLSGLVLLGCSSVETPRIDQLGYASGGQIAGDSTSLYWSTEVLTRLTRSADSVLMGDYGSYQSDYRWEGNQLRELIRKGERFESGKGKLPFELHIRFNKDGEAIYQQYRVNGKVLPLKASEIATYQAQASDMVTNLKSQSGDKLIQGYWDGEVFETCDDKEFTVVKFDESLPSFVIDRLANFDNYMAFVGTESGDTLSVKELLLLNDDDYDCIERPQFISE